MARTAATPQSRLEATLRRKQEEYEALRTLVGKGRIPAAELVTEAQETAKWSHERYLEGHEAFRAHSAEWAGRVATLQYYTTYPAVGSKDGPKPFVASENGNGSN